MAENNQQNLNTVPSAAQGEQEQNIQLTDLWNLVWDHKWWYVFSVILCLFGAAFYLYKTPKSYSRSEKVIVDEDTQNTMMRDLTQFTTSRYRYQSGTNVDNEIEAFSSPDLMEKVVSRLGLETSYIDNQLLRVREMYTNTPVEMHRVNPNASSAFSFDFIKAGDSTFVLKDWRIAGVELKGVKINGHFRDTLETPVGGLVFLPTAHLSSWSNDITINWVNAGAMAKVYCNNLSVSLSSKQSSVLVLSMTDVFPSRAESVLSTLLDIYQEEWINNRNKSTRATSVFINDRLGVIEQELGGIEDNLRDYKQSHQVSDIQSTAQLYLQQSSAMSAQGFATSNQLAIAKMIKQFINDPAHANDLMPANSGLQNVNIESQIATYNQAFLERERALQISSENNAIVQDLTATLEQYKIAINRSIDNLISTLQMQVNKIEDQERQILSRISSTSGQQLELLSIERQQKVKEQLYIFLLQKREENELQSRLTAANTRLIMRPNGASGPVAPNKMMILLVALVLGLGVPFGIFYVRKLLDTTVKSRSDISSLSMPFLAEVPQIGLTGNYWQRLRANRFDHTRTRILVESGKRDGVNEAFRVMRTNLDLMIRSQQAQIIMLTSFNPNAGKTFTLLNLSASMALKGAKVILVDLDLRKATLSKAVSKNGTGVSAYLSGKSQSIEGHVTNLATNLDIMTVGSIPPNPSELLVSERFDALIAELKSKYDYIFFDCPPVDLVADTTIIGSHSDITIFIIRAGMFDKRALPALEQIYQDGRFKRMAVEIGRAHV